MNYELWVMGLYWLLAMNYERWGYGLWAMSYELWAMRAALAAPPE